MSRAPATVPADLADLPDIDDKPRAVEAMFDRIAPRYDALNRLLTFRMDVGWRRSAVRALALPDSSRVLDLACGTGDLCRTLIRAGHHPVGVDFSAGMLRAARTAAPLVRADAVRLPFARATFDGITCGFALRNFAALAPVLAECSRVLRPGGRVALLDVAEPVSPLVRPVHGAWFRHVVPFVGGLVSDRAAYRYLPASTAYLPPLPEMLALVVAGGIVDVSRRTLGFGAAQLITGTRAR
ncbi:MAG: demethylmenaquinone methyltransferase / 2-methoxy-6-polyprenyl,4-benzoquinol methylase [Actinomycetota bacterium]|nr:demethylmenaquinone methyltransferase / 2-methoxy-6-polyprenyl,4-benzoquinol methylase [Actinomycetota bacterium]